MTYDQLVACISETFTKNGVANVSQYKILINHMAKCCEGLVKGDNRATGDWSASIVPYALGFVSQEKASTVSDEITVFGTAALSAEKKDLEDEEEDLCNAQVNYLPTELHPGNVTT